MPETVIEYDPPITEDECLRLGSALTASLDRSPLGLGHVYVKVTTDPSVGAPAWFHQITNEICLDHALLDIRGPREVLFGALLHELGHANFTNWLMPTKDITRAVASAITWFEEIRIERRVHDRLRHPDDLRAMFNWLLETIKTQDWPTHFALSGLWTLTVGRYLTGVCTWEEIETIDQLVRTEVGDSKVDQMREILSEAIEVDFPDNEPQALIDLGQEWVDLFDDAEPDEIVLIVVCGHGPPEDEEEGDDEGEGESAGKSASEDDDESKGDDGDGGGEESTDDDESKESSEGKTAPAMETKATLPTEDAPDDFTPGKDELSSKEDEGVLDADKDKAPTSTVSKETAEMLKKAIDALGDDTQEYRKPADPVSLADPQKAMDKVNAYKPRKTKDYYGRSAYNELPPSAAVRARAASLARTLENLHLPAVAKVRTAHAGPPGRLHGREMVRKGADKAAGRMTSAKPWRATKRVRTSHKPIRVGTMTDTSGSMHWAETLVAEFAWTTATAGRKIGARTAAVTFGDRVAPVVLPEDNPTVLKVYAANGGCEQFDMAAAAMDGFLKLSHVDGSTKVMFVISDGHLVIEDEPERARMWCQQWTRAGVLVFWIGCAPYVKKQYAMPGVTFIDVPSDHSKLVAQLEQVLMKVA